MGKIQRDSCSGGEESVNGKGVTAGIDRDTAGQLLGGEELSQSDPRDGELRTGVGWKS